MPFTEPPTKIWCPPREKHLPLAADDTAPVRIYTPPYAAQDQVGRH